MKTRNLILASLVLCGLHATARSAETGDLPFFPSMPKLEYVYDVAMTVDMLQTLNIRHGNFRETNAMLGERPGAGRVAAYGLGCIALHALVTYELVSQGVPRPIVTAWEIVSIGYEGQAIAHNYSIGLKMRF